MLHKIEDKINKIKIHINKKIKQTQKSFYHSITSRIDPEYIYIYIWLTGVHNSKACIIPLEEAAASR
jgi:hypothetical protein